MAMQEGKGEMEEAGFVQEQDKENEEIFTEDEEASMALVLLQSGPTLDEAEGTLEGDEVLQSLPELDVRLLLPAVVDLGLYCVSPHLVLQLHAPLGGGLLLAVPLASLLVV